MWELSLARLWRLLRIRGMGGKGGLEGGGTTADKEKGRTWSRSCIRAAGAIGLDGEASERRGTTSVVDGASLGAIVYLVRHEQRENTPELHLIWSYEGPLRRISSNVTLRP